MDLQRSSSETTATSESLQWPGEGEGVAEGERKAAAEIKLSWPRLRLWCSVSCTQLTGAPQVCVCAATCQQDWPQTNTRLSLYLPTPLAHNLQKCDIPPVWSHSANPLFLTSTHQLRWQRHFTASIPPVSSFHLLFNTDHLLSKSTSCNELFYNLMQRNPQISCMFNVCKLFCTLLLCMLLNYWM